MDYLPPCVSEEKIMIDKTVIKHVSLTNPLTIELICSLLFHDILISLYEMVENVFLKETIQAHKVNIHC